MKYYKKLIGQKVYLSPISIDDISTFMQWVNDSEIATNMAMHPQIISHETEKEIVERLAKDGNSFCIVDKEKDKVIGTCGYAKEDLRNRNAEIGIMIGEKEYWSQGYGSDAIHLLLNFGFNIRNYNCISLTVFSFNKRAIACYKKVGFKLQGVMRDSLICGNQKYDRIYMDILASEYNS